MEYSDRGRYVTHLVTVWIENDGDHVDMARQMAKVGPESLASRLTEILRRSPRGSAPFQTAQDLAPNDYARIDWKQIAEDLLSE